MNRGEKWVFTWYLLYPPQTPCISSLGSPHTPVTKKWIYTCTHFSLTFHMLSNRLKSSQKCLHACTKTKQILDRIIVQVQLPAMQANNKQYCYNYEPTHVIKSWLLVISSYSLHVISWNMYTRLFFINVQCISLNLPIYYMSRDLQVTIPILECFPEIRFFTW